MSDLLDAWVREMLFQRRESLVFGFETEEGISSVMSI